jgi:hypothetical protein
MRRLVSSILMFVFVSWLLPLGVFIKPSQEKIFCGGQRAICLCSHMKTKNKNAEAVKTIAKTNTGAQKEESSGSSHHYDVLLRLASSAQNAAAQFTRPAFLYQILVSRPVEHIPKSALLA